MQRILKFVKLLKVLRMEIPLKQKQRSLISKQMMLQSQTNRKLMMLLRITIKHRVKQ